eukprot:1336915-Rhodomonas_salina.1
MQVTALPELALRVADLHSGAALQRLRALVQVTAKDLQRADLVDCAGNAAGDVQANLCAKRHCQAAAFPTDCSASVSTLSIA